MEDWYNGPMEETVIANRYKDPPAKDTSSQAPSNGASGAKSGTQAPSNGASGAKPGKDNAGYKPANNGQGSASGNGSSNNNGGRPSGRRF